MIFNAESWCGEFLKRLKESFSEKLVFVGLQGSRARGEARESSDVDIVVVLSELSSAELDLYAQAIASMPFSEKACGFICGEPELLAWSESEKFLLFYDTTPLHGSLDFIKPRYPEQAAARALKEGACAIYHAACHNRLYEKNMEILSGLYKSAFFVMRVKHFLKSARFLKRSHELLKEVDGEDRKILQAFSDFSDGRTNEADFLSLSDALIKWSSRIIVSS